MFDIPVVLFLFKRKNTMPRIISRLREIKPYKIYLLADEGRNDKEKEVVNDCRISVENLIDWDCEIVKNYATQNRGVFENIGEGARWVFQQEEKAIFIEDDNLPEVSFFCYAKEMLEKYEDTSNIAWICGTNYIVDMQIDVSYFFSQHLLPCGWASWKHKFLDIYDGYFENFKKVKYRYNFFKSYDNKLLWLYQNQLIKNEVFRNKKGSKFSSWDYQMLWSIRSRKIYGIVPSRNQITNIGVDENSIHGGVSKKNVMTDRFCEIKSMPLIFPLVDSEAIKTEPICEKTLGSIILPPINIVIKFVIGCKIKHAFGKDSSVSIREIFK